MRIITTNNIAYKEEFFASNKDELKTAYSKDIEDRIKFPSY